MTYDPKKSQQDKSTHTPSGQTQTGFDKSRQTGYDKSNIDKNKTHQTGRDTTGGTTGGSTGGRKL